MNINLIKLLLQLKNASLVKKEVVNFNCNVLCIELLKLLQLLQGLQDIV